MRVVLNSTVFFYFFLFNVELGTKKDKKIKKKNNNGTLSIAKKGEIFKTRTHRPVMLMSP